MINMKLTARLPENPPIGGHHIVLAYLPSTSKAIASGVASSLRINFEGIKICIVVGVCGSVPKTTDGVEIFGLSEMVIEIDFGRCYTDKFQRKDAPEDNLGKPSLEIASFLRNLSCQPALQRLQRKTTSYSTELLEQIRFHKFAYLGADNDKLFPPNYQHKHQDPNACATCSRCRHREESTCEAALKSSCTALGCEDTLLERRTRRERPKNVFEDGSIGTTNLTRHEAVQRTSVVLHREILMVIKSGQCRDEISIADKVIVFEMKGAAVWQFLPTIIVKNVSDYADIHKNKEWQGYSAITATACAKAVIEEWSLQ